MTEEIRKMELPEAYSIVRAMSNSFKAFKDAESVIIAVMQANEEMNRVKKSIELLKNKELEHIAAVDVAKAKANDALVLQESAEADFKAAKTRIEATIALEESSAKDSIKEARAKADISISKIEASVEDARIVAEKKKESMLTIDSEIKSKKDILDGLNAEIAAIRVRLG